MGKTNPQATGQSDAAAMGQVYQQLIAEQEANNTQGQQQQRAAAAGLNLPQNGADTAGFTAKPDMTTAMPGQMQASAPAAQAVDPTAQAAPGQAQPQAQMPQLQAQAPADPGAIQGAPAAQGAGPAHPSHQAMSTIQHIVNALDPGARMRSQNQGPRQPVMSPLPGQQPAGQSPLGQ